MTGMTGKSLLWFVGLRRPLWLVLDGTISKEAPAFKYWLEKQPKREQEIIVELLKNEKGLEEALDYVSK